MKMNVRMPWYKQVILLTMIFVVVQSNAMDPKANAAKPGCKPCAAAAAARLSAAAAAAAALVANKPSREMELDKIDPAVHRVEACCEYCAQPGSLGCQGVNSARCNTCQAGLIKISIAEAAAAALAAANEIKKRKSLDAIPQVNVSRAPREELADPCNTCADTVTDPVCTSVCDLNCKLQALFDCCVNTNIQVRCQGHELEKCCKRLRHHIDDVEELVESQIDQSVECCSVIEAGISSLTDQTSSIIDLSISIVDQSVECCSVTESGIISIIDQTAICCSVIETGITSIIDQSADCCSIIETRIGDLGATSFSLQDCSLDVVSFVDSVADADVITWLKSLYVLMYQVFQCTCCLD